MRFRAIHDRVLVALIALLVVVPGGGWGASAPPDDSTLTEQCDFAITLALGGSTASAETLLVAMLSVLPGDSRALNNLGNLYLLRGEIEAALAFYGRAQEGDSLDAGIDLNRATAYYLLGDEERAIEAARRGIERAGGLPEAASLIGIAYPARSDDSAKTTKRTPYFTGAEIRALLEAAARRSPVDSAAAPQPPKPTEPRSTKPRRVWRPAGARAGVERLEAAGLVYWKR